MAAPFKVFTTTSGFYDLAVATTSQAKALEAWGTRQNLFAEGMARIATDKAVVAAALGRPGVVLRRPIGSTAPFSEDPGLPTLTPARRKR